MVGPAEVNSILRDLYESSRLDITWDVADPVQRRDVRLAFLALMCAETAMPYGGRVALSLSRPGWQLHGTADRINIDPDVWDMRATGAPKRDTPPSQVQFALLPLIARDMGRVVTVQSDPSSVLIGF